MSSGLMDTEKGGEQTQYEAEHTDMLPHKQEAGQLGGHALLTIALTHCRTLPSPPPPPSSNLLLTPPTASAVQGPSTSQPTSTSTAKTNEPNSVGITPADKIRYGQSIQEGGMGGKTGTVSGEADKATDEPSAERERGQQGYGGARDMRRDVGA
ncbi:hypothetical protein SVAN01_10726 [Stagonosporopsis vannaccii]|nr:hypothetical protein SVAN01_10726 [Stagonosporopsis vannaccii]